MNEKNFEYIKAAIYFGLVGLALVVFSVLFQNFIRNTENEKKERIAVQELAGKLEYYSSNLAAGLKHLGEVDAATERLLRTIEEPESRPARKDILLDLQRLIGFSSSATPSNPYINLNAPADVRLIRSEELRGLLSQFRAEAERLVQLEDIRLRSVEQQLESYLNRVIDHNTLKAWEEISGTDSPLVRRPSTLSETYIYELLADGEFAGILADLRTQNRRLTGHYERIGTGLELIKSVIAREYPTVHAEPFVPF